MSCPACKTEQEQSDICISCGVVFEKYKQQQQQNIRNNATETARYTQISDESRTRNVDTAEMPAFKDDRLPDIRRVMGYIVFGGVLIFSALYSCKTHRSSFSE